MSVLVRKEGKPLKLLKFVCFFQKMGLSRATCLLLGLGLVHLSLSTGALHHVEKRSLAVVAHATSVVTEFLNCLSEIVGKFGTTDGSRKLFKCVGMVIPGMGLLGSILIKASEDPIAKDMAEIKTKLDEISTKISTLSENFDDFLKGLEFRDTKNSLRKTFANIKSGMDALKSGRLSRLTCRDCEEIERDLQFILWSSNGDIEGFKSLFESLFEDTDGDPRAIESWGKIILTYSSFGAALVKACNELDPTTNHSNGSSIQQQLEKLTKTIDDTLLRCEDDLEKVIKTELDALSDNITKVMENLTKQKRWLSFGIIQGEGLESNLSNVDSLRMGFVQKDRAIVFYVEKQVQKIEFDVIEELTKIHSDFEMAIGAYAIGANGVRLPHMFAVFGRQIMYSMSPELNYFSNEVDWHSTDHSHLQFVAFFDPQKIKDRPEAMIFDSPFGKWGPKQECDLVQSFKTKVENNGAGDDAALVMVDLGCKNGWVLKSPFWYHGSWYETRQCPEGYTGARVRIERYSSKDITGVNNIHLFCPSQYDNVWHESSGQVWGEWSEVKKCSLGKKICGAHFKFQEENDGPDKKALTGIAFICC